MAVSVTSQTFKMASDQRKVRVFTLKNQAGCETAVSEYGAGITSIRIPDKNGDINEICLGYEKPDSYEADSQSIGITIGRFANRIANSKIRLEGKTVSLAANIPPHHIHGGDAGFGAQTWTGELTQGPAYKGVQFARLSPDGEAGYPGNLDVTVHYILTDDTKLIIDYKAVSDKTTLVNMTNHAYFNLGHSTTIADHDIQIFSDYITPLDENFIATGEIRSTQYSVFDLSEPTNIGSCLARDDPQLLQADGFDINYIIGQNDGTLKKAARLFHAESGRSLTVSSTQPCLQFYTGNNLEAVAGRSGTPLAKHAALCLEAQDYPNGPNEDQFPFTFLAKGEIYHQRIEYAFDWSLE